jgi:uncharacterized protein (TIGR02246 family)
MRYISLILTVLGTVAPVVADDHPSPDDAAAIRKIINDKMLAWNRHDAAGISKDYSEDHDHISVFGGWAKSRSQILQVHTRGHAPGGVFSTTEGSATLEKLRFVRPDVAIATVRIEWSEHGKPTGSNRSTWVLSKDKARWQVVHFHNTGIQPIPQPAGGITR